MTGILDVSRQGSFEINAKFQPCITFRYSDAGLAKLRGLGAEILAEDWMYSILTVGCLVKAEILAEDWMYSILTVGCLVKAPHGYT